MPRCFIGFVLPEREKTTVENTQKELVNLPIDCKFVERENLHMCFSFLGDVSNVEEIKKKLDEMSVGLEKTEVSIRGLKAIPSESYIRVLVLDVVDKTGNLKKIQKEICKNVGGDGKPPHITLGRVRSVTGKDVILRKIEESKDKNYGSFVVDSIQLIESRLSRSGPSYSIIHESKLV